jgi:D-amino-acid dehydrogenase
MKICVIGAGVLGVTTAYMLAKRGHDVTVIDRKNEAARECSFANGGQLSYSHAEPWANPGVFPKLWKWMRQDDAPLVLRPSADPHMMRWGLLFLMNCLPWRANRHSEVHLRLGLYSKKSMEALIAETGITFDYLNNGILHVFSDQKEYDHARKQAEFQASLGCHETVLSKEECLKLEPSLAHSLDTIVGGMHAGIDASGDIRVFTEKLAALATEKHGVTFKYNVSVKKLHAQNGSISGFDRYVLCAGAYSPVLLRTLGMYVPIYPMKGYSVTFVANEHCPTISITDAARKIVYSRLGNNIRVAGTAEFAGYNDAIRQARIAPIMRGIQQLFPKADVSAKTEWACLRPSTPDGPPLIGSTPYANFLVNTGHGTLGWTQAAGSARLLADTLENMPTEIPLTGMTFDRNLIKL